MQLVRPRVVAIAVRILMTTLMIVFQVSFLFSTDIIVKVKNRSSCRWPPCCGHARESFVNIWDQCGCVATTWWPPTIPGLRLYRRCALRLGIFVILFAGGDGGELLTGELAGGTGTELISHDVLAEVERLGLVDMATLDAQGEDGEVIELHGISLEGELMDAAHHVLQDAVDGALRVWRVVQAHVFGELLEVERLVELHATEILAVDGTLLVVVLVDTDLQHG